MPKATESGLAFLDQVLAKLPESSRDAVRAALTAAEATDALTLIGDGVLARSDYSRQMDAIRAKEAELNADAEKLTADHQRLTDWYTPRKDLFDKYTSLADVDAAITAAKTGQPTPAPKREDPVDDKKYLTREEMEQREAAAAAFFSETNRLSLEHFQRFGEVLDTKALIDAAWKGRKTIVEQYQDTFKDQLAAKAKEADDARINKLVDERYNEKLKSQPIGQPYPLRNQSPSVLDVLDTPADKRPQFSVDSAVAEYERLQAARLA